MTYNLPKTKTQNEGQEHAHSASATRVRKKTHKRSDENPGTGWWENK